MGFLNFLRQKYSYVTSLGGSEFKRNWTDECSYIESLHTPKNDIERSYYQYLCQRKQKSSIIQRTVDNTVAAILFIPIKIRMIFNGKRAVFVEKHDAALTWDFISARIFPNELLEQTRNYIVCGYDGGQLDSEDLLFLKEVNKIAPLSFMFKFKCMCRVANYSLTIKKYSPNVIYCSAEYSYTSSILTKYCEKKGVEHVNIMHGEKLLTLREAFCRFSKFYVWDDHYVQMYKSMHADQSKFCIFEPSIPNIVPEKVERHCVYYLQNETKEQLKVIKETLQKLGFDYRVRPHPKYTKDYLYEVFEDNEIEDKKDIWESIRSCGCAISVSSTVLFQAYRLGVPIIIDDISNPNYYNQLFERGYIMLNKEHGLLSEIIQENIIDSDVQRVGENS